MPSMAYLLWALTVTNSPFTCDLLQVQYRATFDHTSPLPVTCYRCITVPFLTQFLPLLVTAILCTPLTQLFPHTCVYRCSAMFPLTDCSHTCPPTYAMVNGHCGCRNWGLSLWEPRAVPGCLVFGLAWSRSEYSFTCFTHCQSSSPLVFVFSLPLFFPVLFH